MKDPDEMFFHITFVAGHGMHFQKSLCLLLNEFDSFKGFYKLEAVETHIREWSDKYVNCYFVAIFACCRENFQHQVHCDCLAAKTKVEAEREFKKREQARKKMVVQPTVEEKLKAKTELNQELLEENEKLKK